MSPNPRHRLPTNIFHRSSTARTAPLQETTTVAASSVLPAASTGSSMAAIAPSAPSTRLESQGTPHLTMQTQLRRLPIPLKASIRLPGPRCSMPMAPPSTSRAGSGNCSTRTQSTAARSRHIKGYQVSSNMKGPATRLQYAQCRSCSSCYTTSGRRAAATSSSSSSNLRLATPSNGCRGTLTLNPGVKELARQTRGCSRMMP